MGDAILYDAGVPPIASLRVAKLLTPHFGLCQWDPCSEGAVGSASKNRKMANSESAQSKGWNGAKPNLRELRESLQITQRQLSDKIGVTENTIANWEHGRSIGKWLYQIKMLCQALDCSFEELTDGLETPLSSGEEKPFSSIRKSYQTAKEETNVPE